MKILENDYRQRLKVVGFKNFIIYPCKGRCNYSWCNYCPKIIAEEDASQHCAWAWSVGDEDWDKFVKEVGLRAKD